ncbi:MAG: cation-binding protein [Verrucomicrobia bacterium]|nr:cation-binding protein [Verrucomicrobiota bacterium]
MSKPLKRHLLLQDLSRDHHHGLLLCWKIRTGFKKEIAPKRMMKYAQWFWKNHLKVHFKIEEETVFPILGKEHDLIKKALSEHRKIKRLMEGTDNIEVRLNSIEEQLEQHIRFEERILFQEVQSIATETELKHVKEAHSEENFVDNLNDPFWEK